MAFVSKPRSTISISDQLLCRLPAPRHESGRFTSAWVETAADLRKSLVGLPVGVSYDFLDDFSDLSRCIEVCLRSAPGVGQPISSQVKLRPALDDRQSTQVHSRFLMEEPRRWRARLSHTYGTQTALPIQQRFRHIARESSEA